MAETTVGILNLEIARLERQLAVINQRIAMSTMYPPHKEKLRQSRSTLQVQLDKLTKQREKLIAPSSAGI